MMYATTTARWAWMVLASAVLAACGGGGGASTVAIRGVAAVGAPVAINAIVSYVCSDGSSANTGRTQADGSYTLSVPSAALPCAVRVTPSAGDVLYSFTQGISNPQTVNLTPLTTLVVAKTIRDNTTASDIAAWFNAPNNWRNVEDGLVAAETGLATSLATAGHTVPSPFAPFGAAFTATIGDPYDDLLESIMGAGRENGQSLSDLAEAFATDTPLPAPASNTSGSPATVNASLVDTYNLAFYVGGGAGCGSACSYTEGQAVTAVVGSNNTLTIDGKTLSNPFFRIIGGSPHTPEIIWVDGTLEYALTNNDTGNFSEINVGDTTVLQNGYPRYLGQIRAVTQSGSALITTFTGTYALAQQYSGVPVTWTGITIGSDGAISFNGGTGPNTLASQIVTVNDYNSCCSNAQVRVDYDLNGDSAVNDSYDFIRLYKDTAGALVALEYQASGSSLQRQVGVRLGTLSALPSHTAAISMPSSNTVAATINGTVTSIALDGVTDIGTWRTGTTSFSLNAYESLSKQIVLQLTVKEKIAAGSTIDCAYNLNDDVSITAKANNSDYRSRAGGRCQITVDAITANDSNRITAIQGRFVAELYDYRRTTPVVINDGVFNWAAP